MTMSCDTVVHNELNPSEIHMIINPQIIVVLLYCGHRIRDPNVKGATIYSIPIAEVPMAGIPDWPANGPDVL